MSTVIAEPPQQPVPQKTVKDYTSGNDPIWCPGCGDFGVLSALYKTLVAKQVDPKDVVFVSGIGCSGRLPGFVTTYGFHGVHGRALPLAMGVKLANPKLTVLVVGGDGDAFAIGGGHIPHACRRNVDITYVVMNNEIYGLTKGQASPTSPLGHETDATPFGSVEKPLNPIAMTLIYGASFVARAYSGKLQDMTSVITRGVNHKGFSFIDAYSPCITFYDTYKIWPKKIASLPPEHDTKDLYSALKYALDPEKIYLGVFYENEESTMEERIQALQKVAAEKGVPELKDLFNKFK
jgi:2-oxoglutarate/2-oxoacid ferredoxin oxidoreductase subunit beta